MHALSMQFMQKYCLVLFFILNTEWKWKWMMNVNRQDCSKFEKIEKVACCCCCWIYMYISPWWTLELLTELTNEILCYIEDCQCQFDVHLIHFHPSQNKRIKISTRGTLSRGGPCISSYTGSHIWSCNVSCWKEINQIFGAYYMVIKKF